ncbi:hypothetical protein [Chitinophaga sp. sic0106]|uniref:hypothetical protein n=1 Tax=Chitinophaga sp. sic0106 TaxID=2854785 RepID=UPI001C482FF2|nr:hypothetical protein [Chitinophaga sp. sic0106]MBV7531325.1 hypothetical protein [Chitinophaga sp. sic0106]
MAMRPVIAVEDQMRYHQEKLDSLCIAAQRSKYALVQLAYLGLAFWQMCIIDDLTDRLCGSR